MITPNTNWQLAVAVFHRDGKDASHREPNFDELQHVATARSILSRIGVVTSFVVPPSPSTSASEDEPHLNRAAWPFAPPRVANNYFVAVLTPPHGAEVVTYEASFVRPESLIEAIENEVVSHWVVSAGMATGQITGRFRPGADSALIAQVETPTRKLVVKAGPAVIITNEVDFMRRVARELPDELSLFPKQYGLVEQGYVAAVLMEAADPKTLDEYLFADGHRSEVHANALDILAPFLELLTAMHHTSKEPGAPDVGLYVYRDRFLSVTTTEGFRQAAARALPEASIEDVLEADWVGNDGTHLPGLRSLAERLAPWADRLVPQSNSIVHGDPHLKNMLSTRDGRPVFIDPRTVWDGNRRHDEGRGDPPTTSQRCFTASGQ